MFLVTSTYKGAKTYVHYKGYVSELSNVKGYNEGYETLRVAKTVMTKLKKADRDFFTRMRMNLNALPEYGIIEQ